MSNTSGITGHPKALYMLFFAEMWERFMFYGNRALLILFMTNSLSYADDKANLIYGSIQALIYTMPLFGGMLADKILGQRKAVVFGGITMALGAFIMVIPSEIAFYSGLGFIICGNGFFKPNISTMVGQLYTANDSRRDSGFSLFYMGINIGALLGSLVCGYVGQEINWHLGFGLSGVFMLVGLLVFHLGRAHLGQVGLPPVDSGDKQLENRTLDSGLANNVTPSTSKPLFSQTVFLGLSWEKIIYIASWICIPIFVLTLLNYKIMDYIMNPLAGITLLSLVILAAMQKDKQYIKKMLAAIVMILFSVLFWGFYEQGGGSLNLFTERNVDLKVFDFELSSAAVNNGINPLYIILLSPLFAWLWTSLSSRRLEPNTPMKFAISFIFLAAGFYTFVIGGKASPDGIVSIWYFALGYFLLSIGELCLSPVGLSMVTKLSPAKLVGLMMGAWFLASAMGQFVAGKIGALMSMPTIDGKAQVSKIESLGIYTEMFQWIAMVSVGAGILLFILVPILKKWMQGIH